MVRLHRLVLRNFKSFKKADIPLSNGFTCIVGGNGSGKSNILDALLFAMGITSLKALRAGRLSELVNNSAVENYAKVELALKHDHKDYVIERLIDKQGKCVYRLDGARKTLGEISSLLLELGVRPDGHNIVVQGDVTRIIEMNALERRQIVDELAGLMEFDLKKEEALKNLEKVDIKLRDAGIIMQERENYLQELQREREAAVLFKELELERKRAKATLLAHEVDEINKGMLETNQGLALLEKQQNEEQQQLDQANAETEKLRQEAKRLGDELLSASEKIYSTIGSKLEEAKSEKSQLVERIEGNKGLLARNNRRVEESEAEANSIAKEVEGEKSRVKQIMLELPALQQQVADLQQRKAKLQSSRQGKAAELQEMQSREQQLNAAMRELNEKRVKAVSELRVMQHGISLQGKQLQELIAQQKRIEEKLGEKQNAGELLQVLQRKFGKLSEKIAAAEEQHLKLLHEIKAVELGKKNLNETIELLNKSGAQCPVCESELRKEKRLQLIKIKETELKKMLEREIAAAEKKADALKKERELKEAAEKERELLYQLRDFDELKAQLKESMEKISAAKAGVQGAAVEKKAAEIALLESEANAKQNELNQISAQRRRLSDAAAMNELQEIGEKEIELHGKLNGLQQEKAAIEGKTIAQLSRQKTGLMQLQQAVQKENREIIAGIEETKKRLQHADAKINELEDELNKVEKGNKKAAAERDAMEERIEELLLRAKKQERKLRQAQMDENNLQIEKSKMQVRLADLQEEAKQFTDVLKLAKADRHALQPRINEIDKKIGEMGAINLKAIESFEQLAAEVKDVREKVALLDTERLAVLEMIEKIDVKRKNIFMQCFDALNRNFGEMFRNLFAGEGRLSLSKPEEPLEAGLLIEAKHKGDNIKNIDSMSGGEKTLTALAFLFAIQLYEPAPFYIFDEADAALDKENSMKLVKIIKEVSKQSQFIAITHNDPLIQGADQIIGVAVSKDKSSVIGLKLREKIEKGEATVKQLELS
jgi:chromosome segregation protein